MPVAKLHRILFFGMFAVIVLLFIQVGYMTFRMNRIESHLRNVENFTSDMKMSTRVFSGGTAGPSTYFQESDPIAKMYFYDPNIGYWVSRPVNNDGSEKR